MQMKEEVRVRAREQGDLPSAAGPLSCAGSQLSQRVLMCEICFSDWAVPSGRRALCINPLGSNLLQVRISMHWHGRAVYGEAKTGQAGAAMYQDRTVGADHWGRGSRTGTVGS